MNRPDRPLLIRPIRVIRGHKMVTAQLLRTAASDGCRSSARNRTNAWGRFPVSTTNRTNHTNNESPFPSPFPSAFVPFVLFVVERSGAHGSWHVHPVDPVFPLPLGRRDPHGMDLACHRPLATPQQKQRFPGRIFSLPRSGHSSRRKTRRARSIPDERISPTPAPFIELS